MTFFHLMHDPDGPDKSSDLDLEHDRDFYGGNDDWEATQEESDPLFE